ncbi:MAG: hypothetical protein QME60_00380 [Verrucomicrobiota bacterium]|nr:hypothetical protein [Verrucomicrobiota bacterium]
MGVQSGSRRILTEIYHRAVSPDVVLGAARIINGFYDQGVRADYGFILDNPYETPDDWRESARLMIALPRPATFSLYSLAFFPGTKLTERAVADGHVGSHSQDLDKRYQQDIRPTYAYFVFYVNSCLVWISPRLRAPAWLNGILLSDFMVKSPAVAPLRALLSTITLIPGIRAALHRFYRQLLGLAQWILRSLGRTHPTP